MSAIKTRTPQTHPCTRCVGHRSIAPIGVYTWGGTINGRPRHSGVCYRCNGSGMEPTYQSRAPQHVQATYANGARLRVSDKYEVSITINGSRWTAHLVAGPEGTGNLTATSTKGPREAAANLAKRLNEMGYTGAVRIVSWPNGEAR